MTLLDALYLPAAILTAPWWARKARSGWRERFGNIEPLPPKPPGVKRILLHAVSVGEVNTLRALVPMLREAGCEVVVSAMTDTGLKRARELFAGLDGVLVVRFCLDFSPAVKRFLTAVNPDAVALVELEVWPNLVRACVDRTIPIGVINGRLSARSFRGYRRFRRLFARTFSSLSFAAVQDADYAARFKAMGVPETRLSITGSMKWDALPGTPPVPGGSSPGTPTLRGGSSPGTPTLRGGSSPGAPTLRGGSSSSSPSHIPPDLQLQADQLATSLGIDRNRPLIVAGSTAPIDRVARLSEPGSAALAQFDCEEALLHAACPEGVQLLCAPRKPEHYERAFAALGGPGRCVRRSAATLPTPMDRFLLDTIGELRAAYALADIAVIGRTWGDLGGSDPIEPIALGKATLLGPRYHNFETIVQTFAAAGAIVIADAPDVPRELRDLLASPARRTELARRGAAAIAGQQGATRRHADLIVATITPRSSP
ncbi:MAG TPA: glycosyltransferase N-terminal domain-containing protein [Phycisphaerales bacterium]|nr:glycosyltransferase N-terminal domain-containing protein [Phycisphaerales bacterium]